jgi:hypothetical protein
MKLFSIFLIIFWIIVIVFPEILAYLIWWFFVFIWLNLFLLWWFFSKSSKWEKDNYVKFGKYKIYR